MKRFISFILFIVIFTVLSIHNQVMAFWNVVKKSVWEDNKVKSMMMNCHQKEHNNKNNICCYNKDYGFSTSSHIQSQNNKKRFNKIKYNFINIFFEKNNIYEWNLIWDIFPLYKEKVTHFCNYISLIWIIKSNT